MDCIFTTYLTKNLDFSQHDCSGNAKPNNYKLMSGWYNSVKKFDLNGVVFHNELSEDFIKKYTTDQIKFEKYTKVHRPSYNDERFYCYKSYLLNNPEVKRVIFTDMFDVQFFGNPFKVFSEEYDLYLGSETRKAHASKWLTMKMKQVGLKPLNKSMVIYNAGIIGGERGPILEFLDGMIELLNKVPTNINANSPVYVHYTNRIYKGRIFTGHPLHNKFRSNKPGGAFIKHK